MVAESAKPWLWLVLIATVAVWRLFRPSEVTHRPTVTHRGTRRPHQPPRLTGVGIQPGGTWSPLIGLSDGAQS